MIIQDSKSIVEILGARKDRPVADNQLFNLSARLHKQGKGSYNYRGDWVMMDQMIVSGNLLNKDNGSFYAKHDEQKVFDEKWILYNDRKYNEYKPNKTYAGDRYIGGYSDHLPIYIKLNKSYK